MQQVRRLAELSELLLKELRARIAREELTVSYLAARSLFSQPYVWHLVHGRRRLSIETFDALMCAAGLTLEDLLAPPHPAPDPPRRRTRNAVPRMHIHRAA